jgi:hypothetical protein
MRNVTSHCLSVAAALALTGSLAGAAQASSTNVVTAIKAQDRLVKRTPGFKTLNDNLNVKTVSAAKKAVPVIEPLVKASARAVRVVAKASTSSAQQRQGKADWIKGSEEEDRGLLEYRTALEDLIEGKHSAFKAMDTKAQTLIGKGVTIGSKGDQLLGISIND